MEDIKKTVHDTDNMIVIDDGRIDVPIRNQFGETIGVFRFNPTDVNIVNRYNKAADEFEKVLEPLAEHNIDKDGKGDTESAIDALNEAESKLIDLFDYILDGNSREAFFSKVHAFTPTNGRFFCEIMFQAVGSFISKKFAKETKKMSANVSKHTKGYMHGNRRKG